jgi:hypothetical protein
MRKFLINSGMINFFRLFLFFIFVHLTLNARADNAPKAQVLREIQNRIDSMKQAMRDMGAPNLSSTPSQILPPPSDSYQYTETDNIETTTTTKEIKEADFYETNDQGMYFIPFGGLLIPSDLEGSISNLNLESVALETGSSWGVRMGYAWKYFYLEERFSYCEAQIKRQTPNSTFSSITINGQTNSLNFHQSLGFRIPVSKNLRLNLGGGIGLAKQQIEIEFSPSSVNSQDFDEWLLTYDAILGLEYQPFDHLLTGINYRWMRVEEMDHFEARDLHLLELSLGVLF